MDKILVVEDNMELSDDLCRNLREEGFEAYTAASLAQARKYLGGIENHDSGVDLCLLDVNLPDGDGFAFCRYLSENTAIPVILLTVHDDAQDMVQGLSIGADDYVTKPFNPLEIVARVKAQMRRLTQYHETTVLKNEEVIDIAGLSINYQTHQCFLNNQPISLTPTEFSILWYLCQNRGCVVSSEQLFQAVWKDKYFKNENNTVMVHIRRLREKLHEPPGKPKLIKTVWGVGYKIEG